MNDEERILTNNVLLEGWVVCRKTPLYTMVLHIPGLDTAPTIDMIYV